MHHGIELCVLSSPKIISQASTCRQLPSVKIPSKSKKMTAIVCTKKKSDDKQIHYKENNITTYNVTAFINDVNTVRQRCQGSQKQKTMEDLDNQRTCDGLREEVMLL